MNIAVKLTFTSSLTLYKFNYCCQTKAHITHMERYSFKFCKFSFWERSIAKPNNTVHNKTKGLYSSFCLLNFICLGYIPTLPKGVP